MQGGFKSPLLLRIRVRDFPSPHPTEQIMHGTLEDRYDIYVKAMVGLGLPYVDFDTWLDR